ncbi:hemolysin [Pseudomonas parafulva]|uniref:Hemolysin n=1 Tax=Pseudomonas parafulva TaxID=157782 RepID=A0AAI8K9V4_9PSED|nr:hemolysin [Pseudomonas parafulva]
MEVSRRLPIVVKITVHYQYNSVTDKACDMKITTPQQLLPVLQPGRTIE